MTINLPTNRRTTILALGAESAGVFAVYHNGSIFMSENFGDLLDEGNFLKYKKAILDYFPPKADHPRAGKKKKTKPDVILTDLHPLYKTTILGEELAGKYRTPYIKVQHHIAHIFSSIGDFLSLQPTTYNLQPDFIGIAADGTGYGLDGNIWGGEVFKIQKPKSKNQNYKLKLRTRLKQNLTIERIGSLEEQLMIGGDLAVREPARMVIGILSKFLSKDKVYSHIKKYYSKNELETLYNQMEQNFNCQKTTSTGRILDAVSVLLGFAGNERKYKHEATKLLESNSTTPYNDYDLRFKIYDLRIILDTTHLFKYLIKNYDRDKGRLAATAQQYIARGFCEIIKKIPDTRYQIPDTIFAAGGMANNKIISSYLESRGVYVSKKIPRGDEGVSMGQIVHYLLNKI